MSQKMKKGVKGLVLFVILAMPLRGKWIMKAIVEYSEHLQLIRTILTIIVFIVPFALIGVSTGCNCTDFNMDSGLKIGMANPAAVYCTELGYEYKIITDREGGQNGICIFPDESKCAAWDFFTGKCGQNYSYCKIHGCEIETVSDGRNPYSPEYSVCVLPNRTKMPVTKLIGLDKNISVSSMSLESKYINVSEITRETEYFGVGTPTIFDWRNKDGANWMTPVKDQGRCASCWAFSAVGAVEPRLKIFEDDPNFNPDLSEEYLVSDCYSPYDCFGGVHYEALGFIRDNGITDEDCLPYVDKDCTFECYLFLCICNCKYTYPCCSDAACSDRCPDWESRLQHIDDYGWVPSDIATIKNYLMAKGPLSAAMGVESDYGGHFDNDSGVYRCSDDSGVNHAVVIVGYNDTGDYWIVKNSWGSNWNEDGYFKVGFGECKIEDLVYYADLQTGDGTSPEIYLEAAPTSIVADGTSNATITATVWDGENWVWSGPIVNFGTSLGSITDSAQIENGSAVATLNAGNTAGTSTITAWVYLGGGIGLLANTTTVKFTPDTFDTGVPSNPVPSIAGTHNGTIKLNHTITVSKHYTYPCAGTGGHADYVKIWNSTDWNVTATWNGYTGDWHNLTFNNSFTLYANKTYNYTICTGSYPQIIHASSKAVTGGTITCTEFVGVNGVVHEDWLPAIRLE